VLGPGKLDRASVLGPSGVGEAQLVLREARFDIGVSSSRHSMNHRRI
jgi:hypothetical protein